MIYKMSDCFKAAADKRNSLAYWFPKIEKLDILTPKTIIVPIDTQRYFGVMCEENSVPESDLEKFYQAADSFGYPVFMRTSQASNKHDWKNSCYVESKEKLKHNLFNLLEHDFMSDLVPNAIIFREFIPMESYFTGWYGEFPVNKELRCFIKDGKIDCMHPYWPMDALEQGMKFSKNKNWQEQVYKITEFDDADILEIKAMLSQIIPVFGNEWWSVDFAKAKDGRWFCIDMALGLASYHYKGCPNEPIFERKSI